MEPGTKVKFIEEDVSKEQINWGGHTDPEGLLKVGEVYTVDNVEVHSWHTKVFLREAPNKSFNSVWFNTV